MAIRSLCNDDKDGFYTKEWFGRREIICGTDAKRQFSDVLCNGLSSTIRKVAWLKHFFLIHLEGNRKILIGHQDNVLKAEKKEMLRRSIQTISLCAIGFQTDEFETITDKLSAWLDTHDLDALFRSVFLDEASVIRMDGKIYKNTPIADPDERAFYNFGDPAIPFLFMQQSLFDAHLNSRFQIDYGGDDKIVQVYHRDFECAMMGSHTNISGRGSFLDKAVSVSDTERTPSARKSYESVLYERDLVFGGTENLRNLIDKEFSNDLPDELIVNCRCTPLLIGDDIKSYLDSESLLKGIDVHYEDVASEQKKEKYTKEYFRTFFADKPLDYSSDAVNLVGFPYSESMDEIYAYLAMLGISVNERLLPDISSEKLTSMLKAPVNILFPASAYKGIYDDLTEALPSTSLSLPPPYGFQRTREWLSCIASALGTTIDLDPIEKLKMLEDEYEALKQTSRNHVLGFVLSVNDVQRMLDDQKFYEAIPLLPLLEEMGFTLDIAIYCKKRDYLELREKLYGLISSVHNVMFCADKDVLESWLQKEEISAVYSDFLVDRRLLRNGKNRISLSVGFELGFEGALRTLKRLHERLDSSFTRHYHNYFGAAR
ncbi:MAG: nitrogenase component 1 [Nanoarchaeota archaeon]